MKKIFFTGLVLVTLASYKKDWTCQCTNNEGDVLTTTTYKDMTKKEAKDGCESGSGSIFGYAINCKIK